MNNIKATMISEINEQHRLAVRHASSAIEHAKRAGELLTQVKAVLPHGEFLAWVETHVEISPRQAQRYMAAAQGRTLPIRRIKDDIVSHLPRRDAAFEPVADCRMYTKDEGRTFIVEQSMDDGFFYCCMLTLQGDDDAVIEYLTRPIRGDFVEVPLREFGLADPASAAWRIGRGCRVASSLGAQQ